MWLSVQYQASTLEEQVANGRPWDLDRTRGGLVLLMPEEGTGTLPGRVAAFQRAAVAATIAGGAREIQREGIARSLLAFGGHEAIIA